MEDKYEFESAEYRIAAIELKAIAYDIVATISKRKTELMKTTKNEEEKKQRLTELNNRNDNLLMLTNQLEEQLEALDSLDKEMKKRDLEEKSSKPLALSNKDLEKKKAIVINANPIEQEKEIVIPEEEPEEEFDTEIEPEQHQPISIEKTNEEQQKNITTEISPQTAFSSSPKIPTPVGANTQPVKRKFQKTTKNISKAIMVKPNQLENLRKSRINQEQKLVEKGIFLPLMQNLQKNMIEEPQPLKKELPDDIERKIEDLTVKANIYYNEGEIDKAQELYDQIKALTNQN